MTTYIYGLQCPLAGVIRYVGKSKSPRQRLYAHITSANSGKFNHYAAKWLRKLIAAGLRPELVILEAVPDSEDWAARERFYIANAISLGWRLTNTTPGGEGGGFVRDEDKEAWRKKVWASLQSEEVRAKISNGVKRSSAKAEVKDAQKKRFKQNWLDPEYRKRVTEKISARLSSSEVREQISAKSKAAMADPKAREHLSKMARERLSTQDGKEKHAAAQRTNEKRDAAKRGQVANWAEPSYRERIMKAKTSADVVAIQSDKAKSQWANPETREKMKQALKDAWVRRKAKKASEVLQSAE